MKTPKVPRKPREVAEVYELLRKNAIAAGDGAQRAYCYFEGDEWRITDNWEKSSHLLIYRDGAWTRRRCFDGEDSPYTYQQALGDAMCWFTG